MTEDGLQYERVTEHNILGGHHVAAGVGLHVMLAGLTYLPPISVSYIIIGWDFCYDHCFYKQAKYDMLDA